MKNISLGYNMKNAVKLKLNQADLSILRWFDISIKAGKLHQYTKDGTAYHLISYDKVVKELPIIYIKRNSVYRRIQNMVNKGILKRLNVTDFGNYIFYAFDKNYELLNEYEDDWPPEDNYTVQDFTDFPNINNHTTQITADLTQIKPDSLQSNDHTTQTRDDLPQIKYDSLLTEDDFAQIEYDSLLAEDDFAQMKYDSLPTEDNSSQIKTDFATTKYDSSQIKTDFATIQYNSLPMITDFATIQYDSSPIEADSLLIKNSSTPIETSSLQTKDNSTKSKNNPAKINYHTNQNTNDSSQIKSPMGKTPDQKINKLNNTPTAIDLATLMYQYIKWNNPKYELPDFFKWTSVFEDFFKKDGVNPNDVLELIRWLYSSANIWNYRIFTPQELIARYDELLCDIHCYNNGKLAV